MAPWLHKLERFVDRVRLRWNLRKRHEWTPTVVPYAALERRDVLRIFARAFQEEPPHPRAREGRLRRLRRMLKRMVIREIPFATLELDVDGVTRQVLADEEGVVDVQAHSPGENGAARVEIRVVHPVRGKAAHVPCSRFARQQENSRFLVISDIDDTVMRMKVLGMRRLIGTILFADASHRTVFEGVPELYRALEGTCGEENPMVYVSSSPWNVHDLVEDFLDLNGVPRGAILLRNWGISDTEILPTRHGAYKRGAIYGVVDFFPDLPAILLGDDAEEDPEIYEQVARDRPGRVEAIFIRRLGRKKSPEENDQRLDRLATTLGERGVPMVVSDSSEEMLAKARQLGIVDSSHARLSNAPT